MMGNRKSDADHLASVVLYWAPLIDILGVAGCLSLGIWAMCVFFG